MTQTTFQTTETLCHMHQAPIAYQRSTNSGQFFKGMEGWGRGHAPFQRRGTLAPVVIGDMLVRGERAEHDMQEHQERDA
jgi:hypothetical protein